MWRYGAMARVARTFSNENILFLGKISTHTPRHIKKKTSQSELCSLLMFCDSDRINYIDPGPCHGLVIKQKKWKPKASFRFHIFLFVTPTGLALPILSHHGLVITKHKKNEPSKLCSLFYVL